MITPLIHRVLKREDLARLVAEIGRLDQGEARVAEEAVRAGEVDAVLDSAAALDAVRGRGGAPAAVPLTLLWYVPVRAALRARGVADVELADYAATLPVVFATWRAVRTVARGETGLDVWSRYVASLPDGTVAQAEGAADVAALALWWAGIFPERVTRRAAGAGMLRAYVAFAAQALALAARIRGARGGARGPVRVAPVRQPVAGPTTFRGPRHRRRTYRPAVWRARRLPSDPAPRRRARTARRTPNRGHRR